MLPVFVPSQVALVALAALLLLQAIPFVGLFFIVLGGPFWAGVLVQIFLIALAAEASLGMIPRAVVIVPLAAYVGYYASYAGQTRGIWQKAAELRQQNPGKVFDFDPERHSLVTPSASLMVRGYAIPVAYERNSAVPEGYLSYRLVQGDRCGNIPKDSRGRIQTFGIGLDGVQNVCELRFPETPPRKIVTVTKTGDESKLSNFGEQLIEMSVDGAIIGHFKTASASRLRAFPALLLGCGFLTGKWECTAEFLKNKIALDTIPNGINRTRFRTPESVMLGIPRYDEQERARFPGYRQNDEAIGRLAQEPRRVEDDSFAILKEIIDGANPQVPHNLGYSLVQNPARLRPFAKGIARRFAELIQPRPDAHKTRLQMEALRTALGALSADSFAEVADTIFELVRNGKQPWSDFPVLYLRAADAGPKTLDYYQSQFLSGKVVGYLRFIPVLAICRIGRASPEAVARLKLEFTSNTSQRMPSEGAYASALFVTLIKLNEERFVRENKQKLPARLQEWADNVLSEIGKTNIGPNNCMGEEWGSTDYLSPTMSPSLYWAGGRWNFRKQT